MLTQAPPTLPGDADMETGNVTTKINDSSSTLTDSVRISVTTQYREERSKDLPKYK